MTSHRFGLWKIATSVYISHTITANLKKYRQQFFAIYTRKWICYRVYFVCLFIFFVFLLIWAMHCIVFSSIRHDCWHVGWWRLCWYHNPQNHSSGPCVPFFHTDYCEKGALKSAIPMKPFWKQFFSRSPKVKGFWLRLIWSAMTSPVILGIKLQTLLMSRHSHGTAIEIFIEHSKQIEKSKIFLGMRRTRADK